jgi:hypothetical protein
MTEKILASITAVLFPLIILFMIVITKIFFPEMIYGDKIPAPKEKQPVRKVIVESFLEIIEPPIKALVCALKCSFLFFKKQILGRTIFFCKWVKALLSL